MLRPQATTSGPCVHFPDDSSSKRPADESRRRRCRCLSYAAEQLRSSVCPRRQNILVTRPVPGRLRRRRLQKRRRDGRPLLHMAGWMDASVRRRRYLRPWLDLEASPSSGLPFVRHKRPRSQGSPGRCSLPSRKCRQAAVRLTTEDPANTCADDASTDPRLLALANSQAYSRPYTCTYQLSDHGSTTRGHGHMDLLNTRRVLGLAASRLLR